MRILVTGAAGFIGSNLTLELQKRFPDAEILVLDNYLTGADENLREFKGTVLKGAVEDRDFVKSISGEFDYIFHQAAITDTTVTDNKRMTDVNVGGFKNILDIASPGRTKVIYASSAGVYGAGPAPMKETQELSPLNAYASSKVKMDEISPAEAFAKKIKIIGLRYFNVYGPREARKGSSSSMIFQLAKQMKAGKAPRIFRYGEQKRDHIYVKDVVEANIKAMDAASSCVVNVGTGAATAFNRVIEILNKVLNTDFKPEYFDNPYDFYQNNTQADTSDAEKLIGFKARYSIEKG
ncbi:MAG: ADP-glyceromanno-heptose 6-epimerase, partial [bacterium]